MLPDRVSNPGPLTYESGALPIALRGPAIGKCITVGFALVFIFPTGCQQHLSKQSSMMVIDGIYGLPIHSAK